MKQQIVTTQQMIESEACAIISGISELTLMENAGKAVAQYVEEHYNNNHTILILCGPGNNGGDGFVIARLLHNIGYKISIAHYKTDKISPNMKHMMDKAKNIEILDLLNDQINFDTDIIIDALFGTGISRAFSLTKIVHYIANSPAKIIAVDIASGINSDTGEIMQNAIKADITITFAAKKLGHLLNPGKLYSGLVIAKDIGVDISTKYTAYENSPTLWNIPHIEYESHKYSRGFAIINGGDIQCTGAARLAAKAAQRSGAGVVTLASPLNAAHIYHSSLMSVMVKQYDSEQSFTQILSDKRISSILLGPGNGVNSETKQKILTALKHITRCILDADALTVFQDDHELLFENIKDSQVVMTPHEGEFHKLFPTCTGDKVIRAFDAAKLSNSIIVLKGNDTIIASPSGHVAVNSNAPSTLATAGSGDVLAGIITGLSSTGLDLFDCACAATWIHAECANYFGIGLIAEDIIDMIPKVLQNLSVQS